MTIVPTTISNFDDETYYFIRLSETSGLDRTDFHLDPIKIPTVAVGVAVIVNIGSSSNPHYQVRSDLTSLFSGIKTFSANEISTLNNVADALNDNDLSLAESEFNTAKSNGQFSDISSGDVRELYDRGLASALGTVRSNQSNFTSIEASFANTKELQALYSLAFNTPG